MKKNGDYRIFLCVKTQAFIDGTFPRSTPESFHEPYINVAIHPERWLSVDVKSADNYLNLTNRLMLDVQFFLDFCFLIKYRYCLLAIFFVLS